MRASQRYRNDRQTSILSDFNRGNDKSADPDIDNAIGMADGGGIGHGLCSEWGSYDTCGYGTKSDEDQAPFSSQTDHTATKDLDGNNRMGWSDLRKTPEKHP